MLSRAWVLAAVAAFITVETLLLSLLRRCFLSCSVMAEGAWNLELKKLVGTDAGNGHPLGLLS